MSLLAILYWVILVLLIIGVFTPVDAWPHARYGVGIASIVLFILIGLKVFKTSLS
jgi:hypothetical protein